MPNAISTHSVRVSPNLLLKPQPNSRHLQAQTNIEGKTYRKSVQTWDVELGKQRAWDWYKSLLATPKLRDKPKATWHRLAREYCASLAAKGKIDYHIPTIKRHFTPYFGNISDIRDINSGVVVDYILHRRRKVPIEPTPQTLNREHTVLRQLLTLAVDKGWLEAVPKIPFLSESQTRRRRRHFTYEEYQQLRRIAIQRIYEARSGDQLCRNVVLPTRKLLYDVIQLMANSGLRVDEMRALTWRCVDWQRGDIVLEHAGKMKSNRQLILRQAAIRALKRIALRRLRWQLEKRFEHYLRGKARVIAMPNGVFVRQMDRGFDALLRQCGFEYITAQQKHALTSLRHTYSTLALMQPAEKRVSLLI